MALSRDRSPQSLEALLREAGGAVRLLRGSNLGPYTFPVIPPEFTNWREEQRAWGDTCALLELSYHMTELHLRGPGALAFLSKVAVNKFDPFPVMRGKAARARRTRREHDRRCDSLSRRKRSFSASSGAPFASDWLQHNAEVAGGDVEVTRDDNFAIRSGTRDVFRIQIQVRMLPAARARSRKASCQRSSSSTSASSRLPVAPCARCATVWLANPV